ncbi:TSUP family transporter [Corynebacterium qintianiae]|uniref:Probable membrane transporter protein n=1 Tax=Corynebacterium qintianiae TaxID=2709392 RepID=A0A7T0PDW0_9CORY|nr:TSUP family transporter [Corynebacterium qintianiae]QPK83323.1 TSUP family transporter [Corynebacterium qintianiae]
MELLPLLAAASLIAGWVDAVIGGGGLVLIPVLMASTGMPPAAVLATNKVAAVTGTASAAVTMVRRVGVPRFAWGLAAVAFVLSACGALAVSLISDSVIRPAILILLVAVGLFVFFNPSFGTTAGAPTYTRARVAGGVGLALLIGFYDGIFGPGTGMFLIMGFTALFSQAFLRSAAMAKVVNTATNLGALTVFIAGGWVDWTLALVLAVANVVGAQLGARTVLRGGSKLVRLALLALVVVLCARLGWQEFSNN